MKYRRRRRIESPSSSSNSGQMMNLSLFIMLLAFFIVLNSISSYEEHKTSEVRRSVELAFSTDPQQKDVAPSVTDSPEKSINEGDTFERLDVLFKTQISSYETTKSKSKGIMMVELPFEQFSAAMLALDQYDLTRNPTRYEARSNFFLPTLISVLKTNIDGAPTRLEIYLNTDDNPAKVQNQKPSELKQIIDKAGVFSSALEKKGLPQKLLNIGLQKGDPKFVKLVFQKYVPFSPMEVSE